MKIFDSHAHYDDKAFDGDRDELLREIHSQGGVEAILNLGTDIKSSFESVKLSQRYDFVLAACGIHPHDTEDLEEDYLEILQDIIDNNSYGESEYNVFKNFATRQWASVLNEIIPHTKVCDCFGGKKNVAIGEIGLDFHRKSFNAEKQKRVFEEQLSLAQKNKLPVSVHSREANEEVGKILEKFNVNGVIHCFCGDLKFAEKVLEMGFLIGVGGTITYPQSNELRAVIEKVPLEKIVLETDAPYLAPAPLRSRRCDSSMIKYTLKKVLEIKKTG